MSLSRAQVRILVDSRIFDDAIRRCLATLADFLPFWRSLRLISQRHRTRLVTRRKQRRHW